MGIKFVPFNRRENRRSLAIFFAEEIAHLGALKIARFCRGAVKIAAATAENRAILVHSAKDQGKQLKKRVWHFCRAASGGFLEDFLGTSSHRDEGEAPAANSKSPFLGDAREQFKSRYV